MQDAKRAEIVGERTYGDAALRKAITMDDGSAVIISVAKYYSPSGKAIQDNGVTPGFPVAEINPVAEADDDGTPAPDPAPVVPVSGEDLLLKKAIEVANGTVKQAASKPDTIVQPGAGMHPLNIPAQPQPR